MQLKEQLKNDRTVIEKVLKYYGANIRTKGNCDCIPTRHKDPKEDLSIKKKDGYVCACHCGLQGDVFSVIKIMEGITSFPEQLKRVCEIIGLYDSNENKQYKSGTINSTSCINKEEVKKIYDFTKITEDLHRNIDNTDYFKNRGFSEKIIEKYKLGYSKDGLNYIIKNYPGVLEEKANSFYSD